MAEVPYLVSFEILCEEACVLEVIVWTIRLPKDYSLVHVFVIKEAATVFALETHHDVWQQPYTAETVMGRSWQLLSLERGDILLGKAGLDHRVDKARYLIVIFLILFVAHVIGRLLELLDHLLEVVNLRLNRRLL